MYWNTKVWVVRCVMRWRYRTRAAGTRHHPIKSCQSTHLILPYLSIIKSSMGILQLFLSVLRRNFLRNSRRRFDTTVPGAERGTERPRDGGMVDRDRRTVTVGVVATARRKFPTCLLRVLLLLACLHDLMIWRQRGVKCYGTVPVAFYMYWWCRRLSF